MLKRLKIKTRLFLLMASMTLLLFAISAVRLADGQFNHSALDATFITLLIVGLILGGTSSIWMIRNTTQPDDNALQARETTSSLAQMNGAASKSADHFEQAALIEAMRAGDDDNEVAAEESNGLPSTNARNHYQGSVAVPIKQSGIRLVRSPILVIDDDYHFYETLCTLFAGDYHCDAAFDEKQAMIKIKTRRYSVILANLTVPNLNAYALIRDAVAVAPTTPLIVVTGLDDTQSAIRAMKQGAFDYITKPAGLDELEMSVRRAVRHYRLAEVVRHHERQLAECASKLARLDSALKRTLAELDSIYQPILSALMAVLAARNVETRSHSERVVTYSLRLARELGLHEVEVHAIKLGALLHDIGKIGIEDKILLKPEQLTSAEWIEMKKHTAKGAQIIEEIPALWPALPVITQHHERWDGTGYPAGLTGELIDIKARVFAVADALDAITSDRPYDPARSYADARDKLVSGAGKQFDPKVVDAFCRVPLEEWAALGKSL